MTVEITTLKSGMRVVTDNMPGFETAASGAWIGSGSRYERTGEHGLAHFLEHMLFKGTRTRSAPEIAAAIDEIGGDINACTSVEWVAYHAHTLASDTGAALEIIGDLLTQSIFDAPSMQLEKSVILQEISETQDNAEDIVGDHFNAAAFPGQAIGRSILGTPETVPAFSRRKVQSFLQRNYTHANAVVSAAGAVRHDEIVAAAQRSLASLASNPPPKKSAARYRGGHQRVRRAQEQTHIMLGFEAPSFLHKASPAIHVFDSAIGGGLASRLFQEVREKRGLAYSINSFYWGYSDTGLFGFQASCAPRDVAELIKVAVDCLAEGAASLNEAEMRRACASMKLALLTSLQSCAARADRNARQMLALGRVLSREEVIGQIDALTLEAVRRAGQAALRAQPTLAIVGAARRAPEPAAIHRQLKGV